MIRNLLFFLMVLSFIGCKRTQSDSNVVKNNGVSKTYDQNNGRQISNAVKMIKNGGVYIIPIEINDIAMKIIFDTGASNISISETEAIFLWKQGKITESDILGSMQFQDATGNISEGTRINLKKVKIANKIIHNVEASVVHNLEAPLLLGQSALSKFGKLTIDYNRNEIIFE